MALGQLPPWLNINPNDFLHATAAGTQMGHAIAEATQRAWENQQRMKMEEEHGQEVLAQQAIQNAMQRLAQDRLEKYRQSEVENAKAGLGLRQGELTVQGQRADEQARRNQILEGIRQADEKRKEDEDFRRANKPDYRNVGGVLYQMDSEEGPIPLTTPNSGISAASKAALQDAYREKDELRKAREKILNPDVKLKDVVKQNKLFESDSRLGRVDLKIQNILGGSIPETPSGPTLAAPTPMQTPSYKIGASYKTKDGVLKYKGGDPMVEASWESLGSQ